MEKNAAELSRRRFLEIGGAGLAAAALLGVAGCGGGGDEAGGAEEIVFTSSPDDTETAKRLIEKFNRANEGRYKVVLREGNADTGQRFDQIRTEFQAGGE